MIFSKARQDCSVDEYTCRRLVAGGMSNGRVVCVITFLCVKIRVRVDFSSRNKSLDLHLLDGLWKLDTAGCCCNKDLCLYRRGTNIINVQVGNRNSERVVIVP